jgi:hypothetical protein
MDSMHRTMEELLALRDGKAPPDVANHVAECDRCGAELERLRGLQRALCELPQLEPPGDGWASVRDTVVRNRSRRRRLRLTAAAALLVAATLVATGVVVRSRQEDGAELETVAAADAIGPLMAASRELEEVLRAPAFQSRVLRPTEAAAIVVLEDDIAYIDLQLHRGGTQLPNTEAVGLWTDRVELLDALVQARGGQQFFGETERAIYSQERSFR